MKSCHSLVFLVSSLALPAASQTIDYSICKVPVNEALMSKFSQSNDSRIQAALGYQMCGLTKKDYDSKYSGHAEAQFKVISGGADYNQDNYESVQNQYCENISVEQSEAKSLTLSISSLPSIAFQSFDHCITQLSQAQTGLFCFVKTGTAGDPVRIFVNWYNAAGGVAHVKSSPLLNGVVVAAGHTVDHFFSDGDELRSGNGQSIETSGVGFIVKPIDENRDIDGIVNVEGPAAFSCSIKVPPAQKIKVGPVCDIPSRVLFDSPGGPNDNPAEENVIFSRRMTSDIRQYTGDESFRVKIPCDGALNLKVVARRNSIALWTTTNNTSSSYIFIQPAADPEHVKQSDARYKSIPVKKNDVVVVRVQAWSGPSEFQLDTSMLPDVN